MNAQGSRDTALPAKFYWLEYVNLSSILVRAKLSFIQMQISGVFQAKNSNRNCCLTFTSGKSLTNILTFK